MGACTADGRSGHATGSTAASTAASATVVPLATQLPSQITHDDAVRLFEYDRSLPLDIREEPVETDGGAVIHTFSYRDMARKRDRAFLVLPEGTGPFGAVMFLAGGLSRHGIASLLIDYPELYPVPVTDREAVTETIFEMREFSRLFDWLASRPRSQPHRTGIRPCPEVDSHRLGLVGVSYGAVRAATFAGVEGGRLKITVLMSVPASYHVPAMAAFDPIVWAPYVSPCALYIQEGTQDGWFTHGEAESLIAAAREPKQLVWYEANHGLNDQATADFYAWLIAALGKA